MKYMSTYYVYYNFNIDIYIINKYYFIFLGDGGSTDMYIFIVITYLLDNALYNLIVQHFYCAKTDKYVYYKEIILFSCGRLMNTTMPNISNINFLICPAGQRPSWRPLNGKGEWLLEILK